MNIKIERGQLVVDIFGLLECLTTEERIQLADTLACTNEVITYVTQQILDGWTEHSSHGSKGPVSPEPAPCGGLDWAVREVSLRSGELAANEIRCLQKALKLEQEKHQKESARVMELERHVRNFARHSES